MTEYENSLNLHLGIPIDDIWYTELQRLFDVMSK